MRKLLGKVSVYLDDESTSESSRLHKMGHGNWSILLTPKVDQNELEYRGIPYNGIQNTATSLAHEFGHLIGVMLHSPNQREELSSEVEAWKLAKIEYPNLDEKQKSAAMGTYR